MKNTSSPEPKTVSKRAEKEYVQPARVSDMGMGKKALDSKEVEKKQPAAATV